ncbi:MAG TPA: hypothetical protein VFJ77_10845 [Gaiellaceae bacterium]|nr:hypothetical protein [Gaiellaceae bacterium]
MSETEQGTGLELLLREPEIVAWLDDYREAADEDHDEPPEAA